MPDLRALLVDDEPLARRGLRQHLAAHPDVVVVGECRNGREALRAMETLAPDLVFLDVQMPGLDGFGVLRERGAERLPAIVFVTAYDEFAVAAFEAHALDYLVKPVSAARFDAALARAREHLRREEALALRERLAALLAAHGDRPEAALAPAVGRRPVRRIAVPTAGGERILDVEEIDWIEADDYYAAIHAGGRRHLIRESLASLEARLDPARFVRVHRSAIVSLPRVRELRSSPPDEAVVVLRDGTRVPVSRRRLRAVAETIRRAGG